MPFTDIDIHEDELWHRMPDVLDQLLRDHTTGQNILWCTHDYESLGDGYGYHQPILPQLITGYHRQVIRPRVMKTREQQTDRSKDKAEVFTPSWVCNAQNNLVDEGWFGRKDVFNTENVELRTWYTHHERVTFPEGKTWKDYVRAVRMEITCGEAPYLVSRYDATTGTAIPLSDRIGLLDRKLRVVCENVDECSEWLEWAQLAYKSIYGYEWQGDNLLLAREALLYTFIEYYHAKFGRLPMQKFIRLIAYIISWNLWQMDGLKGVVPDSCNNGTKNTIQDIFGIVKENETCIGCKTHKIKQHIGRYSIIKDWEGERNMTGERGKITPFVNFFNKDFTC